MRSARGAFRANMESMFKRVLLVAPKGARAVEWQETLRNAGCTVLHEHSTGERAWRAAKERGIEAVVIDGEKKPSLGRQAGQLLRDTQKTAGLPIVWTNLDPLQADAVQAEVAPDRTLAAPTSVDDAMSALRELARERTSENQPASAAPNAAGRAPTLHAHVHSLMGSPSYLAAWAERSEPETFLVDPFALEPVGASAESPPEPSTAPPKDDRPRKKRKTED